MNRYLVGKIHVFPTKGEHILTLGFTMETLDTRKLPNSTKFILGVVWSTTVLKWTGAISWGANGKNFMFLLVLRILVTIVEMGLCNGNSFLSCGCWTEVL